MRRTASDADNAPPSPLLATIGQTSSAPEAKAATIRIQLSTMNFTTASSRLWKAADYRIPANAATPPAIRHGESTWNLENRFTGWTDVALTDTGVEQARQAGRLLREAGYEFDMAYTSVLKRAIWTLWHCLDQMDRTWLPIVND